MACFPCFLGDPSVQPYHPSPTFHLQTLWALEPTEGYLLDGVIPNRHIVNLAQNIQAEEDPWFALLHNHLRYRMTSFLWSARA